MQSPSLESEGTQASPEFASYQLGTWDQHLLLTASPPIGSQ